MFESMRTRWQEARGTRLKEEFLDASRRLNGFSEEDVERFGRTLDYCFRYWITKNGPVKDCLPEFRRIAAKELKSQAKQRYSSSIGASYGLAFLSFHVEASYLPGDDASSVYDMTAASISIAGELVKLAEQPQPP
jgi:hypothetical protein